MTKLSMQIFWVSPFFQDTKQHLHDEKLLICFWLSCFVCCLLSRKRALVCTFVAVLLTTCVLWF